MIIHYVLIWDSCIVSIFKGCWPLQKMHFEFLIHTIGEINSSHDRIAQGTDNCHISRISHLQAPYFDFYDDPRGIVSLDFPACYFAIMQVEMDYNINSISDHYSCLMIDCFQLMDLCIRILCSRVLLVHSTGKISPKSSEWVQGIMLSFHIVPSLHDELKMHGSLVWLSNHKRKKKKSDEAVRQWDKMWN